MKNLIYIAIVFIGILISLQSTALLAQSNGDDYLPVNKVRAKTYLNAKKSIIEDSFYDGLGTLNQKIQRQASPEKRHVATFYVHDMNGNEVVKTLPIPMDPFRENSFYTESDMQEDMLAVYGDYDASYETTYLNSLGNIVLSYGPGKAWRSRNKHMKTEKTLNWSNDANLKCLWFEASDSKLIWGQVKLAGQAGQGLDEYLEGTLNVIKTTDEDNNISYTFYNSSKQLLLSRQINEEKKYDTYYVYDIYGNLRYVLPPMASDYIASKTSNYGTWINEEDKKVHGYCYSYTYDSRNRCIASRWPGCDWTYYVYDKADRLRMQQNGNQRIENKWTFYKYDAFGRIVIEGVLNKSATWAQMQSAVDANSVVYEEFSTSSRDMYTWRSYPASDQINNTRSLIVNYYDNYNYTQSAQFPELLRTYIAQESRYKKEFIIAALKPTGQRIETLEDTPRNIYKAFTYDETSDEPDVKMTYHLLNGLTIEKFERNKVGHVNKRTVFDTIPGVASTSEKYVYEYDHVGRLIKTNYQVNNETPIVMSEMKYNEHGQLQTKEIYNAKFNTQYLYNIRGWLTYAGNSLFRQNIAYNTENTYPLIGSKKAYYNGNISAVSYGFETDGIGNNYGYGYTYDYDNLGRLKESRFHRIDKYTNGVNMDEFNESLSYDKHGNITDLKRTYTLNAPSWNETVTPDLLQYRYNGNQLQAVDDGERNTATYNTMFFTDRASLGTEYLYDKNGNMVTDYNKRISKIKYNYLNLPYKLQMEEGHVAEYVYDATGTLLYEQELTAKGTSVPMGSLVELTSDNIRFTSYRYYVGNKIYNKSGSGLANLQKTYTEEGTFNIVSKKVRHLAYIKDHLGSVRAEYDLAATAANVKSLRHYYPFGVEFSYKNNSNTLERFNGKQVKTMHGQNFLDYGARMYDPTLARWHVIDPLAEKYYSISPYTYCLNNPVKYIDPDGRQVIIGGPALNQGVANTMIGAINNSDLQDAFILITALTGAPAKFSIESNGVYNIGISFSPATFEDVDAAKSGLLIPAVGGNAVKKLDKNAFNLFDGANSTTNKTSREALRNAKDQNGIPRSQQPDKTSIVRDKNTGKPLKQYEYTNSKGEKVLIRKDNPVKYPDGGSQGKHYNAGKIEEKTDKLKQHHNYDQ
ncbi:hypothetical protein D0T53_03170 [Dysgonomonas sp. 216]|uniref:RHS repeat-associated core domain-containing protein n=1 Tax=Dysgonomonas sp. 216 TaxID=2302934 RepID=UPI0013D35494|nr:RHS repeat-associated core domain-containing protein [Dysgonomonas sp. 216]NDW17918.1 hypothetical protein [Dysgonomonas sp. 216]